MKTLKLFLFMMLALAGCNRFEIPPTGGDDKGGGGGKLTIYVAGAVENGLGTEDMEVTYWKDGKKKTVATNYGGANSIFVAGNDVYVAGWNPYAAYWKNGKLTQLDRSGFANSIFVQNDDVHVAGVVDNEVAAYWKNGVVTKLTPDTAQAAATSVFVSQSGDVHVVGYAQPRGDGSATAMYWKNGESHPLSGADNTMAESVFVSGNDVYVAGYTRTIDMNTNSATAKYWRNGVAYALPDTSNFSFASSVFVSSTGDVYVAGFVGAAKTIPVYWKNGVATELPASDIVTGVSSIVELNGDIYVAGTVGRHAVYWKNGVMTTLNDDAAPNGSSASSIFLAGKAAATGL